MYREGAHPPGSRTIIFEGREITSSDFSGTFRQDTLLGYAPRESTVSPEGWWITDELGARHRDPVTRAVPPGRMRVPVFGDSYAAGSRVRQDETWSSVLVREHPGLDVLNFAVDGYGMAQSYLRYTQVRDRVDHDVVMLMFAPTEDLWRDINVLRSLRGWTLYHCRASSWPGTASRWFVAPMPGSRTSSPPTAPA